MNSENRDFIIERLERQLKEKETEIEDIKINLRDSILREIRSDLKTDMDINNRIVQLEHKVQALTSNLNGIMDELLDQKSMLRSIGELSVSSHRKEETKPQEITPAPGKAMENTEPRLYRPENEPADPVRAPGPSSEPVYSETPVITAPITPHAPPEMAAPVSRASSKVSIRSTDEPEVSQNSAPASRPSNLRFKVRDAAPAFQPGVQEPEPPSEYIVAETDEERKVRNNGEGQREPCDYIVAEEESARRQTETEYETVEARDDEDAVIIITRRK
ncbi:hypothetical protein [Methanolobus halotolerans]|uniref:Uncharacterized protein n=1 Tax=Methanolobus halotolerans TaxID=2052935 RepID=A0A4E0PUV3_9EURY|nr:hypothetical protein [Methanolobus halotolerans]TGC07292.1 hypothetical protein CUN85_11605 [Methanolobus halotolerans]